MRDLIKKALYEHRVSFDTIDILRNYEGSDSILQDFKRKIEAGYNLTEKQFALAVKKLKSEFYSTSIYGQIINYSDKPGNYPYRSMVISKGKETYNNIMRTSKRDFFKPGDGGVLKIDKPTDGWIKENKNSLKTFLKLTRDSQKKFMFPNREFAMTTHEEAKALLDQLERKDFWGFLEMKDSKYVWSILNKVDTNYINWAKMISKRDLQGDLGSGSIKSKIDRYFEQQRIDNIYQKEMSDMDDETKRIIYNKALTLSLAEFDLIESFLTHLSPESDTKAIDHIDNIMDRLKSSTNAGDMVEEEFVLWLHNHGISKTDIKRFNTYGNLVDVTFQVDLIVKLNGNWVPIQVKNRETRTSKLISYDIGGMIIYPAPERFQCGNWIFYNGRLPKSFDEVYFDVKC